MKRRSRPWLLPLVPLYAAALALRHRFAPPPKRLQGRVISIGSLSAGGAGKTPVVILIAEMLRAAGHHVDVLSRGYGRTGKGIEPVDPDGLAYRFGDEPMLLARRLAVPVWVGAERIAAGQAAEACDPPTTETIHLLDDGFQHQRLARDVDVVLLTEQDVHDGLLPAGNLREPLRALHRVDIVVLRQEEAAALRAFIPPGKTIWLVRRRLAFAPPVPPRPLVFCGIARPDGLLTMLREAGVTPTQVVLFADHHAFGMRDITRLLAAARACAAEGFVTTAKDEVKLTPAMRRRLQELGPIVVAELTVELVEGALAHLFQASLTPLHEKISD